MRRFVSFSLLLLCLAAAPPVRAGKKDKPASPGSSPAASPPKFNIPIPPGHGAEGVKLPYFDDHGRLQMFYSIKKTTRTDQDHMEMNMAELQTYDDKGSPETNIFMKRSTLDLNTRIVTSEVPVTIQRADLRLTGDTMIFDTVKRQGRMVGHIRMVLYNNQSAKPAATAPPAPAVPAASPAAAASPTAP